MRRGREFGTTQEQQRSLAGTFWALGLPLLDVWLRVSQGARDPQHLDIFL